MKILKKYEFEGHNGAIYSLAYNSLNNTIYSGGFDNIIVEWNIDDPKNYKAIAKLPTKTISLLFIPKMNWLLCGQSDGGVHIIDLKSKKEVHYLKQHSDMIFALTYNETSNKLYIGSGDGILTVWDLGVMSLLKSINLLSKKIRVIKQFNNHLLIGCGDGTIKFLNKDNYQIERSLKDHFVNFSVNCVVLSRDEKYLISGSRDGHLNIYNTSDFTLIQRIPAHNFAIYKIIYSPDNAMFISVSRDKSIKIWDAESFDFLEKITFKSHQGHLASINDVLWETNKILTTGDDRKIICWEIND